MARYRLGDDSPQVADSAYIADNAQVIGKVVLHDNSSVWFNATLRGDNEPIVLGVNSNVQEGAVLHTDPGYPLTIGAGVTIGHQAMLHGCTIGDNCLIGIQAVVLNGAKIGKNVLIGAGALVTEGKEIPDNSMVVGSPGRIIRTLTEDEVSRLGRNASNYVQRAQDFKTKLQRID